MDAPKITHIKTLRLILLATAGWLVAGSMASAAGWQSWTSFSDVRRMRLINDTVYMATSGGLLAAYDPDNPGREYTNLDGLGTVDITDVIVAADGLKWVSGFGRLIQFNGLSSRRFPFADNDGAMFALHTLEDDADNLWIGSSRGLILFSKVIDGGQIQDSYELFGNLNASPDVYDIELFGDSIMLATSAGLAIADRSSPTALKAPAAWNVYSLGSYPELGTDTIRGVVVFESDKYITTTNGLFMLDQANDTLIKLPFATSSDFHDMKVQNDTLFVFSDIGVAIVLDSILSPLPLPGLPRVAQTGINQNGVRWVGLFGGGIYNDDSGSLVQYTHTGLPFNDVAGVSVTSTGLVTVLFGEVGTYELRSGQWVARPIGVGDRAWNITVDGRDYNWVGTWGAGLSRIRDSIVRYDNLNSTLRGVGGAGSRFVVSVGLVATDDLIIGTCFQSWDGTAVAIGDLSRLDDPSGWIALGTADGINDDRLVSVDYADGAIAVGSGLMGVFYYHLGADPFDKADDRLINFREDNKFLVSDEVRVVRFSPDGELWVGTNFGLARFPSDFGFFDNISFFVDVNLPSGFGPDIAALEFDSRSNVWVGAANGLVFIDAISGDITRYTQSNSNLVSDQVRGVSIDQLTGDVYVSTDRGISVIMSSIGQPTTDLNSVLAFPNPFVINSSDDRLNFNFAGKATLRIFTVAGELVAELAEPVWNGRRGNGDGELVASGVYLFVLTDENGNVGQGKFLLVRN